MIVLKATTRVLTLFVLTILLSGFAFLSGCATLTAEKNAPPIGKFVDVNGERLHVLDAGPRDSAKPPVVLIHGASVNLRDQKIALGDELAADRRVIMIDRPGRGYSTRPDDGHRIKVQAELINGALKSLDVRDPIIVGQSLGGAVALAYALQYQDEMSGLVLLAAVSHEWPGGVAWYNEASQIPVLGVLLRRLVIPVYGQLAAERSVEESFAPDTPPPDYAKHAGLALLFRPSDFKNNAADLANLKPQIVEMQDDYGSLRLPVAIVVGDSDDTVSPEIHSKTLATEVDGASLTVLADTGHALHHAETEKIIAIIDAISAAPQSTPPLAAQSEGAPN